MSGFKHDNNNELGMIVGQASGEFATFDTQNSNLLIQNFTNPTTFGGTTFYNNNPGYFFNGGVVTGWNYFQIEYDGTNLFFRVSVSGLPGTFMQVYSNPASSMIGAAPSFAGLNVNAIQAAPDSPILCCDWWRGS
jgi:hypothetical protein